MSDTVATFTDENWDKDVRHSPQPVLVDFWAEWCVPCRALAPIVEQVAEQFAGRLRVGKMNVEEAPIVPNEYNITTLPTLLLIKNGVVAEQRVGLISKDKLIKLVEPHL